MFDESLTTAIAAASLIYINGNNNSNLMSRSSYWILLRIVDMRHIVFDTKKGRKKVASKNRMLCKGLSTGF